MSSLITVICMDPQSPNKLIATKYCFLILGDDTSLFFFIFSFSFCCCCCYFMLLLILKNIFHFFIFFLYFFYDFFFIFIFSCSGMFQNVPECSGMFRNVPCPRFYRRPSKKASRTERTFFKSRDNVFALTRHAIAYHKPQLGIILQLNKNVTVTD